MKPFRIMFFVIVITCQFSLHKTANGVDQEWSLKEIIEVSRAHSAQIKDIKYTYTMQTIPIGDPNYVLNYDVTVLWIPEKNWEKRTVRDFLSASPDEIHYKEHGWDGEYDRWYTRSGQPSRSEGVISTKKAGFSTLEPLELLGLRGNRKGGLIDYLNWKDILVEGVQIIDGRETVVVSVNQISNLPRKDSLIMKYWLDMKCGGLPRQLEMYFKGKIRRVTSDVTISQIKSGLFFPTRCRVRTFGGESEGRWSKGEITTIQVDPNSIKVNQGLQKEYFNVEFEHGQPVWNEDIGATYYEGLETGSSLEKLVNMLDQLVDETFDANDPNDSE